MHARAVVAKQRLRHERRGLPVFVSGVLNDVLKKLQVIGGAEQARITKINFALTGGGYFVVMTLNVDANL